MPEFDPVASMLEWGLDSSAAVPIQIGFVKFGGISCSDGLLDSGYSDTIAIGRL